MGRYLVDQMCGRLIGYLRFCGHDAIYVGDLEIEDDADLISEAMSTDRTIISRDRELCRGAPESIALTSHELEGQLRTLAMEGVSLTLPVAPTRCGRCNGHLQPNEGDGDLPAYVPDTCSQTYVCQSCGQHFWKGSHWDAVETTLAEVQGEESD